MHVTCIPKLEAELLYTKQSPDINQVQLEIVDFLPIV